MLLSQSTFAKLIKTTRQTVNNLVKDGVIEFVNKKIDSDKAISKLKSEGRLDDSNYFIRKDSSANKEPKVEEANIFDYPSISNLSDGEREAQRAKEEFEKEMREEEAEKIEMPLDKIMNPNIEAMSKNDVERVKLYWQGMQERVKYEKEIGLLVLKSEVEEEHFLIARTVRDAVMSISNRIAYQLLGKTEIHDVKNILDMEAHKILENLSR